MCLCEGQEENMAKGCPQETVIQHRIEPGTQWLKALTATSELDPCAPCSLCQ